MGQQADSGRHAELDEKKQRSAGRKGRTGQQAPGREQMASPGGAPMKGKTGGASGRSGKSGR